MSKLPEIKQHQWLFEGERLRLIREAHELSQLELADVIGVTRTQITNLERGSTEPGLRVLVALCEHFEVSADWLLGLTEELPAWMEVVEVQTVVRKAGVKRDNGNQP